MSDLSAGARVEVVTDLYGDGRYVGKSGVVVEFRQYAEGDVALDVRVKLDGYLGLLDFHPDELEVAP